jgi:hypothetical protein
MILEDAREYIFPLFLVDSKDNGVFWESRKFLGTGFFVSHSGDAITACHVLPSPEAIPAEKRLIAIVQVDNKEITVWITHSANFPNSDLALFHTNLTSTKCLELSEEKLLPGADIQMVGIPEHEIWHKGKEMRLLKGHITMSSQFLELNIPIPPGMTGGPVFLGSKVVAFATKSVYTHSVEDSSEEHEALAGNIIKIEIIKYIRAIQYGLAYPFSNLIGQTSPIFGDKTLFQLIELRNHGAKPLSITVDNGSEFAGKVMDAWADLHQIQLAFIRPGKPIENAFIESFNGRLRQECLNVEIFRNMAEVHGKLAAWRQDFNQRRPHSSIGYLTPMAFAARNRHGPSPSPKVDRLETGSVKGESALDPAGPQPLLLRYEGEGPSCEGLLREGIL